MKVVVAVKLLDGEINEWDTFAVEAALELGDEVVVAGVADDDEALLTALAMGADRAVHVKTGEDLASLATARLLAPVIEDEAPDLVLCGANGTTGVALAALTGLNRVAVVKGFTIEDGAATCERELEGGLVERVRVPLPALITVQTGINEPRYATLRGIRQASSKPMAVIKPDAIEPGARVVSLDRPPKASQAQMLEGDVAEQIAIIIKGKVA